MFDHCGCSRCDAEPGALADYILALLKHNVPENEMRNELAVQLDEFLEKGLSCRDRTVFCGLSLHSQQNARRLSTRYSLCSGPSLTFHILRLLHLRRLLPRV